MIRPSKPFTSKPLTKFLAKALLCLPLCLAVWWFWVRGPLLSILEYGAEALCSWLFAEYVVAIETRDMIWWLTTSLSSIEKPLALLVIPIPADRFTISLPLFWGIALAVPGLPRWRQLLAGSVLLLPIILLMALLFIQFQLGLHINHQAALTESPQTDYVLALPYSAWAFHLMGLGRQLALLILPTLSPLLVWGLLNQPLIRSLIMEGILTRLTTARS